jgi:HAE1 family hydrophobic/amphiphilic exporter-1
MISSAPHPEQLETSVCDEQQGRADSPFGVFHRWPSTGPSIITRFNLYRSIKVEGSPAAGKSSGQAIQGMDQAFEECRAQGLGFDWTGLTREEIKAGALAIMIFSFGILVVFLVLAAQYESLFRSPHHSDDGAHGPARGPGVPGCPGI